jgi:transposase InsO family protein
VWKALDYPCAERLHPVLLSTAEHLEKHGECSITPVVREQLSKISCSTLRRRLLEWKSIKPKATISSKRNKPKPKVKSEVPIDTYKWDEKRPGALEVDLVEHNGGSTKGHYACTLNVVDIVTGYSSRRAIMGKGQKGVFEALKSILEEWPVPPWSIHTDNGSEFINNHLATFCKQNNLKFTSSRPYRKNDNAHVEQNNRHLVREFVGYERYDTEEQVSWLNKVYKHLDSYSNAFLPMRKVVSKWREGSKVKKRFDLARSPIQRLIDSGHVDDAVKARLRAEAESMNPAKLQEELWEVIRSGSALRPKRRKSS